MDKIYPFAHIIHVFCAIVFIGFLFFDVVIFSRAKKSMPADVAKLCEEAITKTAVKIMPFCVLGLLLTGGMMITRWVNSDIGFFQTNVQILFMIKVLCACVIFAAVIMSLSCKFIFKVKNPLSKIIHPLALTLAVIITILAKIYILF